ncbi:hypothetical protein J2W34_006282 [Variovorax boronicumulans]|nr:hypothetical protein [Variovorax boronicumulans]
MPMTLLSRLCCAQLPLKIDDQSDIEKCDVLRAAQLIEADLPPVLHQRGRTVYSGQATVMRVTAKGQSAAKQHR